MLARLVQSGALLDRFGVGKQSPVDPTALARIRELYENLIETRQMTAGKDPSRPKGLTALCDMLNEIIRQEPGLESFKPVPFTGPAQLYLTFDRHAGWAQIKQDATATWTPIRPPIARPLPMPCAANWDRRIRPSRR